MTEWENERLEKVRERHEQGFITSLEFQNIDTRNAKEVLEAEREADPIRPGVHRRYGQGREFMPQGMTDGTLGVMVYCLLTVRGP